MFFNNLNGKDDSNKEKFKQNSFSTHLILEKFLIKKDEKKFSSSEATQLRKGKEKHIVDELILFHFI